MQKQMKVFFQSFVFCFVLGSGWGEARAGGHAGGGGDIRRFRSQFALFQTHDVLEELSKGRHGQFCNWNPEEFKRITPALVALERSRIRWSTDESDRCLKIIPSGGGAQIELRFSYAKCPLPTPKNYYLKQIFEGITRGQFGVETLLHAIDCRGGIRPPRPPSLSFQPSDFRDPRKAAQILQGGRKMAVKALQKLDREALEEGWFPEPVAKFLLRNRDAFLQEVARAPHSVESTADSCGFTKLNRGATIYFSREKCMDFQSDLDVAWVILHESTHHFGVEAENFADAVATSILHANSHYDTY